MAYFTGRGYSGGFTDHMARLLEDLTPERPVRLTVGADAVCAPCPNNRGGLCDKPELVASWDRQVLALCGLDAEQILRFGEFTRLVEERILAPGRRPGICGSCQWNDICAVQLSRWAAPRPSADGRDGH